jgi:glycosyltransferase involved in cell wall biosynthesis
LNKSQFSTVVITKNEEAKIGATIDALVAICDDIVVIDSGSQDNTLKICLEKGVTVHSVTWGGYSSAKNAGARKAKYDWILSIDADEVVDEQLALSLQTLQLDISNIYSINRMTNYCGNWIKHSGWFPDWKTRLYHKGSHQWNDALVHEDLTNSKNLQVVKLKGMLLHYSYDNLAQHDAKIKVYAMQRAKQWVENKKRPSIVKRYIGKYTRYLTHFIYKLGFLDGKAGHEIALREGRMVQLQVKYFDELKLIYICD